MKKWKYFSEIDREEAKRLRHAFVLLDRKIEKIEVQINNNISIMDELEEIMKYDKEKNVYYITQITGLINSLCFKNSMLENELQELIKDRISDLDSVLKDTFKLEDVNECSSRKFAVSNIEELIEMSKKERYKRFCEM